MTDLSVRLRLALVLGVYFLNLSLPVRLLAGVADRRGGSDSSGTSGNLVFEVRGAH
jgi:hypothetical protein